MSDLFISYRRQDAAAHAGRLYDALVRRYGEDRVFFDIHDLSPGEDFATQLHGAVAACRAVLVVIGRNWVTATDAEGRRRITDPSDFIGTEIAAALRSKKHVVPILVGGSSMPRMDELPIDLHELAYRNALELRDAAWEVDLAALYQVLDGLLGRPIAAAPMLGSTASAPATRAGSFFARILTALDVLTGRRGGEQTEQTRTKANVPSPPTPPPAHQATSPRTDASPAAKQIFVSYAEEDRTLADEVVDSLEGRGHACWIAHRNIPAGSPSWAGPIVAAIASSRVLVILVTPYSVASRQVLREITIADNENIPLIPVCIDNVPLSKDFRYFFASAQRLELEDLPREQIVVRIGQAVEKHFATA